MLPFTKEYLSKNQEFMGEMEEFRMSSQIDRDRMQNDEDDFVPNLCA